MRNTLRAWSALLCVAGTPALADVCEDLSASILQLGASPDLEDRRASTLGVVGDSCPGLPDALGKVFRAVAHASPGDRPLIIGGATGPDDALSSFEAACAGWTRFDFARDFVRGKPASRAIFKACRFDRFKVVSEKEFSSAEVHFATAALVMYAELSARGLDPKVARQLARIVIIPSEAPAPPPQPAPTIKHFKDLSKKK